VCHAIAFFVEKAILKGGASDAAEQVLSVGHLLGVNVTFINFFVTGGEVFYTSRESTRICRP
jgi:hypothetical protein